MNHEFCIQCGHKNSYEITKPRFCAGCGSPFNTTLTSKSSQQNVVQEEEEYVGGKFDIDKLRESVAAQVDASKVSLDDLWKNPERSTYNPRQASQDPEGNAILKQVMIECKGNKEPIEINV